MADGVQVDGGQHRGDRVPALGHKECAHVDMPAEDEHREDQVNVGEASPYHALAVVPASEETLFTRAVERAADGLHGSCMQALAVDQVRLSLGYSKGAE